jgi:hypothetical protein
MAVGYLPITRLRAVRSRRDNLLVEVGEAAVVLVQRLFPVGCA